MPLSDADRNIAEYLGNLLLERDRCRARLFDQGKNPPETALLKRYLEIVDEINVMAAQVANP